MTFRPGGCELEDFGPQRILQLLANRTLWLWGDSFSQQLHRSIVDCSFFQGSSQLQEAYEDRKSCHGAVCMIFPSHGAHICSVRADNSVFSNANKRCLKNVRPRDILVVNIGLHFNDKGPYAKAMKAGMSELQRVMKKINVLWRTNPPQHFDKPGGNFYAGARNAGKGCKATGGVKTMQKLEWRNAVASPLVRKAKLPIIHVWDTAVDFPQLHPAAISGKMDCLHWCEYSSNVLRVWNSMMLNYIAGAEQLCGNVLIQHCEHVR